MNDLKQGDSDDELSFFSPKLREVLRRIAYIDRRSEEQELIWLVETRAYGKLFCQEGRDITPLISLEDLPSAVVERAGLLRKFDTDLGKGYRPPPYSPNESPSDLPHKT